MARGRLRVYLGAAPGVGKTFAMLGEGHRRRDRGTDVVVGFVESHGRPHTAEMVADLEVVPRRTLSYRGSTFAEMDVDAVLARKPAVVLVDELAHTNVPGSRNDKRWRDVEEMLASGIDVITTVNIQHLESLNDVVLKITGIPQREQVPDAVVRAADQVELVDMSPEALRRRMAHGNIYGPEKVDAALGNYFRVGNLTALRELALLWTADKVDEALQTYRAEHRIQGTWEARERVVVAITGGPEGETLIRRAARIAARSAGGDLLAVHITKSDGLTGASPAELATQRRLVESLGGTYHQVIGDDIAEALITFAKAENATQLVLGGSRRNRWRALLSGSGIGASTVRESGDIDVHIVTHAEIGKGVRIPRVGGSLTRRRRVQGFVAALALPVATTAVLVALDDRLNLVSDVLLFMLTVVVVALIGGMWPAVVGAIVGAMLMNYYFTPPLHRFTIAETNNSLALAVFVLTAVLVASVVDVAARRTREAARSAAESETLGTLAGSVLRGEAELPALLERVREAFALDSVTLLERQPRTTATKASLNTLGPIDDWVVVHCSGHPPCIVPAEADTEIPAGDTLMLALRGRSLRVEDQRIIGAFAAQAAVVLERTRLNEAVAAAAPLAAADRMRTALLAAVGHDLRTPLAAAKAAVTSLRSSDVQWTVDDRDELLITADESLDRLAHLVENLLDMSRLQAGALTIHSHPVALDEVLPLALDQLAVGPGTVHVSLPEGLPEVHSDPGLLERVLANLIANAVRYSPGDRPPLVAGSTLGDRVEVRIIDRGPGIPADDLDQVFAPFQRLGDTDNSTGLGLGLALSRGLTEAMDGTLVPEETPGGGLTMVLSLPIAYRIEQTSPEPGRRERDPDGAGQVEVP